MPRRTDGLKIRHRSRKNAARGVEPTRLLFHPVIHPGEGATAFLFRVARRNGTTLSKLQQLGIAFDPAVFEVALSWDRICPSPEAQQYVERLTGLMESAPRAWATTSPRCCSQCLREQQYWSAEWELRQYLACTKHKCWLVDRCGVCNERISWNRAALHRCDCGAGFVDAATTPAPSEFVELSAMVGSKLRTQFPEAAPFAALSLNATNEMVTRFMRKHTSARLDYPMSIRLLDDMQTAIPALELAASVFAAWPSGYMAYLRSMHQENGEAAASILATFGGIY
ncbi:TPA: TniQ family protein [Burkholderia vietnamiensis]|uniref:TniQ family protein n=1 Tax=Burkholderia vietnamiensis TaxID=60552 RepID=UPI001B9B0A38|nr:TniQ family protein [Burkholderia vietnamiensis]HDR9278436.1 TniQ family protein [Burkholderia vietnamiensis]